MAFQHIEVKKIAGALGAEVFGVDLSKPLSNAEADEVNQAYLENLVVFFPGQKDDNNYRLLDARDGWNYMAVGITRHPTGAVA